MVLGALAFSAGGVDAVSYLGLGHVFTANMTGNTVLLAVAAAEHSAGRAARSAVALAAFCAGVALWVLVSRRRRGSRWPDSELPALLLGLLALSAMAIGWAFAGPRPDAAARYLLIAASAIAMGLQSAITEASGASGISTTYMTGTLTRAIRGITHKLARGGRADDGTHVRGGLWLVYILGAAAGAFAETSWHAGAVAIPVAVTAAVTLTVLWRLARLPSAPGSR